MRMSWFKWLMFGSVVGAAAVSFSASNMRQARRSAAYKARHFTRDASDAISHWGRRLARKIR